MKIREVLDITKRRRTTGGVGEIAARLNVKMCVLVVVVATYPMLKNKK
jgi:hypothetical protein